MEVGIIDVKDAVLISEFEVHKVAGKFARDNSVPRKILNIAANLSNTAPYWRDCNRDLDAM